MNEIELVERIRKRARGRGLVLGIGDDCAIFRPRAGEELLFTTDMLIEGRHFLRETHPASAVGHKALARGLSDIAAMGGEARFCLLSLALPEWADGRWIDGFYDGLLRVAEENGCALAGGDLARAERVMCDIVVCGAAPRGEALRRSGAKPGDGIYVSGRLGGSALGLETRRGAAWKRHLRPEPRLALGRFLRGKASAAMDLSDGLSIDLKRMCLESGVAAELEGPVPVFRGATLEQALHGGEDYELLFTARGGVPERYGELKLTRVGTVRKGVAGEVRMGGETVAPLGWDHFR